MLEAFTLANVVYLLKKQYQMNYTNIEAALLRICASGAVEVLEQQRCELALALQVRHNVDFEDAYLAVMAQELGGGVASFGLDLQKLGVGWLKP